MPLLYSTFITFTTHFWRSGVSSVCMLEPRTYFKILVGSKFLISNLLLIEKQCSVVCKKTKSMCHLKDARAVESMGGALHVGAQLLQAPGHCLHDDQRQKQNHADVGSEAVYFKCDFCLHLAAAFLDRNFE